MKRLVAANKVVATKMAAQTQVQQQEVTTKDPKEVETGKRLIEYNCRKREEHVQLAKAQSEPKLSYYGA